MPVDTSPFVVHMHATGHTKLTLFSTHMHYSFIRNLQLSLSINCTDISLHFANKAGLLNITTATAVLNAKGSIVINESDSGTIHRSIARERVTILIAPESIGASMVRSEFSSSFDASSLRLLVVENLSKQRYQYLLKSLFSKFGCQIMSYDNPTYDSYNARSPTIYGSEIFYNTTSMAHELRWHTTRTQHPLCVMRAVTNNGELALLRSGFVGEIQCLLNQHECFRRTEWTDDDWFRTLDLLIIAHDGSKSVTPSRNQ
jgi:hypothetical protein